MRVTGLLLAACATLAAPAGTLAATKTTPANRALFQAAFVNPPQKAPPTQATADFRGAARLSVRARAREAAALGEVFKLPAYTSFGLDTGRLLAPDRYIAGQGLVRQNTLELMQAPQGSSGVYVFRLTTAGVARAPGGVVTARPDSLFEPEVDDVSIDVVHGWPGAWQMSAGDYDADLSPHAGFSIGNFGSAAEAGAMVRVGPDLSDKVIQGLNQMGVHTVDGARFGDRARWYLFAAASGKAVGLNMMRDADGNLRRYGLSTDPASAMIGDAQLGLGWRKGSMQASFGYIHRNIKTDHVFTGGEPVKTEDSVVAFSLSIKGH